MTAYTITLPQIWDGINWNFVKIRDKKLQMRRHGCIMLIYYAAIFPKGDPFMRILILNGSPKGKHSITLQTLEYL